LALAEAGADVALGLRDVSRDDVLKTSAHLAVERYRCRWMWASPPVTTGCVLE
jgi:hypothetical protein